MSKRANEETSIVSYKKQKAETEIMKSIQNHIKGMKKNGFSLNEPAPQLYFIQTLNEFNEDDIIEAENIFRARANELLKRLKEEDAVFTSIFQKNQLLEDELENIDKVDKLSYKQIIYDVEYHKLMLLKFTRYH